MLFFGCRHPDEDYLYRDEFEAYAGDGTLSKLETAFSRVSGQPKTYVQHRLREMGERVHGIMEQGGTVYICGDGAHMAKDVRAALADILVKHGGMSGGEAESELQGMVSGGRLVVEVWEP